MTKKNGRNEDKRDPSGWPSEDVRYIQYLDLSDPEINQDFKQRVVSSLNRYKTKFCTPASKNVRVKVITDKSHPAYGQRGLFAARNIKPREWILHYSGQVLPDSNQQTYDSNYCLQYTEQHSIDGWKVGNEARFINDYRGIPCSRGSKSKPNVEFAEFDVPGGKKKEVPKHIATENETQYYEQLMAQAQKPKEKTTVPKSQVENGQSPSIIFL